MNDHRGHFDKGEDLPKIMTEGPAPKKVVVSPLGWGITGRLLWAAAAAALLWLAVAWAMERLP
jgi:hypothetical protein